jgi:hypothetical protein
MPDSLRRLGLLASALIPVVAPMGTIELHDVRCRARSSPSGHPAVNTKGRSSDLHVPCIHCCIHFRICHVTYVLARCKGIFNRQLPFPTAIFLRKQIFDGIFSHRLRYSPVAYMLHAASITFVLYLKQPRSQLMHWMNEVRRRALLSASCSFSITEILCCDAW